MIVDTIENTARRLNKEGYNVSSSALRNWVRDGSLPANKVGKKVLLYYPAVLARVKYGRAVTIEEVLNNERNMPLGVT